MIRSEQRAIILVGAMVDRGLAESETADGVRGTQIVGEYVLGLERERAIDGEI